MKSQKEIAIETKIIERLQNYPKCLELVEFLLQDEELKEMQDYANNVSIKRLGFNDHGPVHMRQVAANSIKMLKILHESGIKMSLEEEEIATFEDSMSGVVVASLMHDLGMMVGRQNHEETSVILALPLMDKALNKVFPNDIHRRVLIKSLALESIIGHMSSTRIHSLEAGVILVADGCDMTKGRARIPLAINNSPKAGDIHLYSANAITRVSIRHGENKPIKIEVEMSSEVGFFQIEEILLPKIQASTAKQYVELYACVTGQESKCYL